MWTAQRRARPAGGSGRDRAPRTKLVAVTHMSNVLGTRGRCETISGRRMRRACRSLLTGSQAAVHQPVDMSGSDCDFYAITGHKLYGPSGSGAIHICNPERMAEMRPFIGGGDMIREVTKDAVIYNADPPMKFEAGTPGIVQTRSAGRGAGIHDGSWHGEHSPPMKKAADERLYDARRRLDGLNWLAGSRNALRTRAPSSALRLDGAAHAHDISTILGQKGVAVRAGQHCAGR